MWPPALHNVRTAVASAAWPVAQASAARPFSSAATRSSSTATFTATTKAMEGADNGPLLGLYPHHWFRNPSVDGKLGPVFDTVRGQLRLLAASQFKTTYAHYGFVPYWPAIEGSQQVSELQTLMKHDLRSARQAARYDRVRSGWDAAAKRAKLTALASSSGVLRNTAFPPWRAS